MSATSTAQTFTVIKSFGILTNVSGVRPFAPLVQGPDGTLYGTTYEGEGDIHGTVFKLWPDGSNFTVLKWFTNSVEGANPHAALTLSGNVLYGTTQNGGASGVGAVFKVNTDGAGFAVIKHFSALSYSPSKQTDTNGDGAYPLGSVALSGNVLYGTASEGGFSNYGTVFKVSTDGSDFTVLMHFGVFSNGIVPKAGLILSGNTLYGTTSSGGRLGGGTIFKLKTDGSNYVVTTAFHDLSGGSPAVNGEGACPADLVLAGSTLFGTTQCGGSSGYGTVFAVGTDGTGLTVVKTFTGKPDGASPSPSLVLSSGTLYGTTQSGGTSNRGTVFKLNTDSNGFAVLKNFAGADGATPSAGLAISGSTLYGTTYDGGAMNMGTLFNVNTDGSEYAVLKHFASSGDAANPHASVTLSGNTLYGTTYNGGTWDKGTVFRIETDGTGYSVIKPFTGSDGANPPAEVTLVGSFLYGTTHFGGCCGNGTVFGVNTDGTGFNVVRHFSASDGAGPEAGLTSSGGALYGTTVSGTLFEIDTAFRTLYGLKNPDATLTLSDGTIYGTEQGYGFSDYGDVFKLNTNGTGFTYLMRFGRTNGWRPRTLTLSGGTLFGTTYHGGDYNYGTVFKVNTNGTGFAVLKHFTGTDGAWPEAGLTLFGGKLYGTTSVGGSSNYGTVFRINTDGTGYRVLKHFTGPDGRGPFSSLTPSGTALFGTTEGGGSSGVGSGTVFKLDLAIPVTIRSQSNAVVLTWADAAFTLQAGPTVMGIYTNIPGATSPYTNVISGNQRFFRLVEN